MPRDQPEAAILLIQVAAMIAQHEPTMGELLNMLGMSRAQVNRYIATLRAVGCKVVADRKGNHRFFRIEDAGVFSLPALRAWHNTGEQEAAPQALADESQRLGLYELPATPHK